MVNSAGIIIFNSELCNIIINEQKNKHYSIVFLCIKDWSNSEILILRKLKFNLFKNDNIEFNWQRIPGKIFLLSELVAACTDKTKF